MARLPALPRARRWGRGWPIRGQSAGRRTAATLTQDGVAEADLTAAVDLTAAGAATVGTTLKLLNDAEVKGTLAVQLARPAQLRALQARIFEHGQRARGGAQ